MISVAVLSRSHRCLAKWSSSCASGTIEVTRSSPALRSSPTKDSMDLLKDLQETIDFPMKFWDFPVIFPLNKSIERCAFGTITQVSWLLNSIQFGDFPASHVWLQEGIIIFTGINCQWLAPYPKKRYCSSTRAMMALSASSDGTSLYAKCEICWYLC